MAWLKQARGLALECYVYGLIDEEEYMLLYDINQSKNLDFPYENCEHFKFDDMNLAECLAEFRVEKLDISRLADALGIHWSSSVSRGAFVLVLKDFVYMEILPTL